MDHPNSAPVIFTVDGGLHLAATVALHVSQTHCFCGSMLIMVPSSCCKQLKLDSPVDGPYLIYYNKKTGLFIKNCIGQTSQMKNSKN